MVVSGGLHNDESAYKITVSSKEMEILRSLLYQHPDLDFNTGIIKEFRDNVDRALVTRWGWADV